MSSKYFYKNIPVTSKSFVDLISHKKNFKPIPEDWFIIVADIENSTEMFDKGKYKDMNIVSSSTVAVAVNVAIENHVEIPFIYGGDGSTIIAPKEVVKEILGELITLRENAKQNFNITMRIGYMSVADIYDVNKKISVTKFLVSEGYTQAVFLGEGLYYAEEKIKNDRRFHTRLEIEKKPLNLEGLQCRCDEIRPPKGKPEVVTLIIESVSNMDTKTYLKVLHDIEEVYGNFNQRHPITSKQTFRFLEIRTLVHASKIKYGRVKILYIFAQYIKAFLHSINVGLGLNFTLFRHDDYTDEIIAATDTLKIDGTLKTIIAGTYRQREKLLEKLSKREKKKQIWFGHYTSLSSTQTCYIHKRNQQYINLIDGTDGGYVQAAKILKKKKQQHDQ